MNADPPSMVALRWCPACGRTDRESNLPDKHVKPNSRRDARDCPGKVEAVTYTMFKVLD